MPTKTTKKNTAAKKKAGSMKAGSESRATLRPSSVIPAGGEFKVGFGALGPGVPVSAAPEPARRSVIVSGCTFNGAPVQIEKLIDVHRDFLRVVGEMNAKGNTASSMLNIS